MSAEIGTRYGQWSGKPKGTAYNPDHCKQPMFTEVWDCGRQCNSTRGWGTGGLFCWHHADVKERFVG